MLYLHNLNRKKVIISNSGHWVICMWLGFCIGIPDIASIPTGSLGSQRDVDLWSSVWVISAENFVKVQYTLADL